ncbi:hypothetical protein QFC24_005196 [Naganishia onofrii]|uniref:Uncharacterized protein n=1 Tax=Naganishia onofrii TaxID=1851511 RepID=A0ACC2X9P3_9TREE|nr:hypothetical protein QFC24_005196 [Naganishia onofrii]
MLRALFRVSQRAIRIQLEEASRSATAAGAGATSSFPGQGSEQHRPAVGAIPGFWVEKPRYPADKSGVRSFGREEVKDVVNPDVAVNLDGKVVEAVQDDKRVRVDKKSAPDAAPIEDTVIQQDVPISQAGSTTTTTSPKEEEPTYTGTSDETHVPSTVISPLPAAEQAHAQVDGPSLPPDSRRVEKQETIPSVNPAIAEEPKEETKQELPLEPRSLEELPRKQLGEQRDLKVESISPTITNDQAFTEIAPNNIAELDDVEQTPVRPLVAGMSLGAAGEVVRRSTGQSGQGQGSSIFMSEANIRRLVDKLSKMRGAALKLGQFMSIQDTNVLPEQLERVLQQVQANADYMPDWQLEKVMRAELGNDWESAFADFPRVPIAAASIGQVHRATLVKNGMPVAVKVQFPGVEDSISSDLNNLTLLLRGSAVLPRGLFLNNTVKVFRGELADECNYEKEAEAGRRMKEYLKDEEFFEVPQVVDELSTRRMLTTEMMSGRPLSESKAFSQELRDKLQLIDFGATREYSTEFIDKWYRLLKSVIDNDREAMREYSLKVGYLTGEENEAMLEAHLRSMELLAVPFTEETYDFSKQSVTDEVKKLIPTMLKYRLTPPPNETYSLNRKLSGSFLLCAKLGSRVNCRALWEDVVGDYKVTTET